MLNKRALTVLIVLLNLSAHSALEAQWMQIGGPTGSAITTLVEVGTKLLAGTYSQGIYFSTDDGVTWIASDTLLAKAAVHSIVVMGSSLFAGTSSGVYRSTDGGVKWTAANSGMSAGAYVNTMAAKDTNLFAGTNSDGVYRSSNGGASWTLTSSGMEGISVLSLLVSGNDLFAGTYVEGLYRSTNGGGNWALTGLTSTGFSFENAIADNGVNLFVGTDGSGVFRSTDHGPHWSAANNGLASMSIQSFAISGTNIFAGTLGGGAVYLSTNGGTNWKAVNTGLADSIVYSFLVKGSDIYAGTASRGLWKRPLTELVTDVKNDGEAGLPSETALYENYPNPFSGTTTISFSLSQESRITVKVYTALGEEVKTLVDGGQASQGRHDILFNSAGLKSGIYWCRLTSENSIRTQPLLIAR